MIKYYYIMLITFMVLGLMKHGCSQASVSKKEKVKYPTLKEASKPEKAGVSSKKLRLVDRLIEQEIKNGFPGAVLLVIKNGKVVKNTAYGYAKKYDGHTLLKNPQKMKVDTLFDLASNTKMYAVNYALQHLVSEGKLDIYETVQSYFSTFRDNPTDKIKGKNTIRIIDLLQHTAGFPSSVHYHHSVRAGELYSQDRKSTQEMILKTPLLYEPHSSQIYSDINYLLLGLIIEKVTAQPLDKYVETHIYKPLGLKSTKFNPLKKGHKVKGFAATELMGNTRDGVISFPNIRTYTLQGEAHDEKSFYSMDGVSGHAGLFSTTGDLAVLLQVMLNNGGYGKVKLFDKETIELFVQSSDLNPTYGLGWRINGNKSMEHVFSEHANKNVIGHTGWTGTITVIDRDNQLAVALLTNKKHSPVVNPRIDPNRFQGDTYEVGQYRSIIKAVYEAMIY